MIRLLVAALIAWSVPTFAEAKVLKLGTPVVAQIDLPVDWKPTAIEHGYEATSPDEELYLAVEVASVNSTEKAILEAFQFLADQGVKVDDSSVTQKQGVLNGMPVFDISAKGKDEDGEDAEISVAVAVVNETTMLLLTYWGTPAGEKTHAETLAAIAGSLRKAN